MFTICHTLGHSFYMDHFIRLTTNYAAAAAAATKSLQLCLTLCDPIDRSPPGSSVPGILQARTLEWVAISFSNAWVKVKVKSLSRVRLSVTPWTVAHQAPPSMGFSRPEHWSGLPFPSPGHLSDPGIEPQYPALEADALPSELPGKLSLCQKLLFYIEE